MTSWRLQPDGIESVLTRTGERRGELAGVFSQAAADDVGAGLGWSPLCADVVTALGDVVSGGYGDVQTVLRTTDAAMTGVYNATVAYHQAGADMADQFEAAAVTAASTGDFAFFEHHGYQG